MNYGGHPVYASIYPTSPQENPFNSRFNPNNLFRGAPSSTPSTPGSQIGAWGPGSPVTFPRPLPSPNGGQIMPLANGRQAAEPTNRGPAKAEMPVQSQFHEFWKGKLGPLPGFITSPGLLIPPPRPIEIRKPSPIARTPAKTLRPPQPESPAKSPIKSVYYTPVTSPAENKLQNEEKDTKSIEKLDKYANIFVPQYLKDIQRRPHNFQPLPPIHDFPPRSYLYSFLSSSLVDKLCEDKPSFLLTGAPAPEAPPLSPAHYHEHWSTLLAWELDQLATTKSDIVLYKLGIRVGSWAEAIFVLYVPGIRENHPRLEVGDIVHLREVLEVYQTGSGVAFEGRVAALRKRDGFVHIFCPSLKVHILQHCVRLPTPSAPAPVFVPPIEPVFSPDEILPLIFNVTFLLNARPILAMESGARSVHEILHEVDPILKAPTFASKLAKRWLFPLSTDLAGTMSIFGDDYEDLYVPDWVDQGLNEQQKQAISSVALNQSPVPFLISGPPGTGKTRTLVELVVQIMHLQPEACVLLCAPSNPATDTLVLRLSETLKPHEMLRLNDEHRTFAEVPSKIMAYCYVENDHFAIPPWKQLMRYRVIATSCLDASILVTAQCTNRALGRMEAEISSGLHPWRQGVPDASPHWTHLLVDEAAQGSEPELLVPISVVLPFSPEEYAEESDLPLPDMHMLSMPQLILCGDYNQLGPIIASELARNAELDTSLLERLFERPLYAEHAQSRSRLAKRGLITHFQRDPDEEFVPFANLIKNYRSHPAILMPPSALFYDDSLEPQAKNGKIVWSGLQNPRLPLLFIGHNHPEDSNDERASWFNTGEIEAIVKTVASLMQEKDACEPPLRQDQIGIMAPWREQVWKIRERLRSEMMGGVDVGTVEDYQGRENRVIIISCVRSSERFLDEDGKKALGFVHERKRMNVAITRAKELLVVIGNGSVLQKDTYWKGFLQFTLRHKLYVGPEVDIYLDGAYISLLESEFLSTEEELDLDAEEKGAIRAGGMVRDLLRGWV